MLLILISITAFAADPFRNLGEINLTNKVGWGLQGQTNLKAFNIYVSPTNEFAFVKFATVTTNWWLGDTTKNLEGWRIVMVSAISDSGQESDPSEKVLLQFKAGKPLPPGPIQFWREIHFAATNDLPAYVQPPPSP